MNERIEPVTLLLVDDEARNLDVLVSVLDDPSYTLLRAGSADDALKMLLENEVAAIVLDIKMPGVSGFELAETIKGTKRFRQVPILFITAYLMDDQNVIAGYGAGAVDYLTKPINPQVLRQKIAVFAELFRKTRALAELNETLEERVRERTAELEKSEAALRAADRQKDEFLAILAHELRNPLAPLSMGVDILQKHVAPNGSPVVGSSLARMKRQVDHMVRLIDDLLDVSRITSGSLELKKERTDLAAIVQTAAESARPFLERRNHTLSVDVQPPVFASVDHTRVAQVLGNLLHNAVKFTPIGGVIKIELGREGSEAVIRVIDRGAGIAPEHIERVFDMFARIDRTSTMGERGLGIGLALARRLAKLHGGTLSASSEGEGLGTTFMLRLPAEVEAPPDESFVVDAAAAPETAGRLKVLVIEDNPDVADTLAEWLEDMGHKVWVARSGLSGVELVAQNLPDVVLCDLGLPELDGVEVCRSVRGLEIGAQPMMVALTGWGREDDRRRTKEAGFDAHLVKPVAVETLLHVLRGFATRLERTYLDARPEGPTAGPCEPVRSSG
jgi:signal transduction histidine kinase